MRASLILAGAALAIATLPAQAQQAPEITAARVKAHVDLLAGPALRGRGSATPDEAAAAAYVGAMFRGFGLQPAPGMQGFTQPVDITRMTLAGAPVLTLDGVPLEGATLFSASSASASGTVARFDGTNPAELPRSAVIVATNPEFVGFRALGAAAAAGAQLVIVRETEATRQLHARLGAKPRLPAFLTGETPAQRPALVTLPDAAFDALVARAGGQVALRVPLAEEHAVTTNAIGYLPGHDPEAGVLLVSAHLDHLGVQPDGTVMYGANDDASGTAAVIELARTLSSGKRLRRGILFVAYGSEEAGGFGARRFAEQPPVPLDRIVANLEIEMIGDQDPKLPAGYMMMTGFDRSTFGETLKAHGALVTQDPYPEENFFQRSDNYALALKGVVAHTVSGWAVIPTYHTAQDTVDRLNLPFMARAIQSLVAPLRSLANSNARPEWKPGGRPGM